MHYINFFISRQIHSIFTLLSSHDCERVAISTLAHYPMVKNILIHVLLKNTVYFVKSRLSRLFK